MSFVPHRRNEFTELIFEKDNKKARLYLDDSGLATEIDNGPIPTLIADSSKLNFERARFEKVDDHDTYFDIYVDPTENILVFEDKNGVKKEIGANSYVDLYVENIYSSGTDMKFFALNHTYDFLKYSNAGGYLRFGPDMVDGWFNGSSFMLVDKLANTGGTPLTSGHGTLAIVGKADTYGVGLSEGILFRDLAGTDYAGLDFRSDDDDYRFLGGKTVPSENTLLRLVVRDNATVNGDHLLLDPSGALLACPYESIWFNTGDKTNKLSFVRASGTGINTLPDMTKGSDGSILEINANAFNTSWEDTAARLYFGLEDNSGSQPIGNIKWQINDGTGSFMDAISISGQNKTIDFGSDFISTFNSNVTIKDGLTVVNNIGATNATISGTLTSEAIATPAGILTVGGHINCDSEDVTYALNVGTDFSCGNANIGKDVHCGGAYVGKDLSVDGTTTLTGNLTTNASLIANGSLYSQTIQNASSILCNGDFTCADWSSLQGDVTMESNCHINGNLVVDGSINSINDSFCHVYLSADQSTAANLSGQNSYAYKVQFDQVSWDIGNDFNLSTSHFVAPQDGYYEVRAQIQIMDTASTTTLLMPVKGYFTIGAKVTNYILSPSKLNPSDATFTQYGGVFSQTIHMVTNDELYLSVGFWSNDTNSNISLEANNCFLEVRLISG